MRSQTLDANKAFPKSLEPWKKKPKKNQDATLHITAHSPSCLCCGTPISSNVFGPLPGGLAGGFAAAAAGFGVVEGEGRAGPSVRVTGFLPGTSLAAGGGLDPGREEGAEVRPGCLPGAGVEAVLL